MTSDWVRIYSASQMHDAQVMKARLEQQGIAVMEINKKDSSYNFGDIELYVRRDDFLKAQHLLQK